MSENFFKWNSKLDLKVGTVDEEHKVLVQLMNDIYQLNLEKKPFDQILDKIDALASATHHHFKSEETFFSGLPYDKAATHKAIHKDLLTQFAHHMTSIKTSRTVPESFFLFLKVWLTAHIMGIDTGYAKIAVKEAA